MKRLLYLLRIFLTYVLVFVFMKPVFMLYNSSEGLPSLHDMVQTVLHGLPLDCSTAGYLTALPLLVVIASCFTLHRAFRILLKVYYALTAFLLAVILCTDCALYSFWQFKLDATVFHYLDSPKEIFSSVSLAYVIVGVMAILLLSVLIYLLLNSAFPRKKQAVLPANLRKKLWNSLLLIMFGGVLFLFIRGGVGKSTMNIGRAYFSERQFLNHSAVNPAFSLIYSSLKSQRFNQMFQFFPNEEAEALFQSLGYDPQSLPTDSLLRHQRPHVVLILMEGFGASFIESLQGAPGITPQFDRLAQEGVLFSKCYANSFRTDRGTVSALSGYPAFPHISVMKLPDKSRSLASIAKSLSREGYTTHFLYGGDINFTNMNSYLLSTGYQEVVSDTYFPSSIRHTHAWGVTDAITFDTIYQQLSHLSHQEEQHPESVRPLFQTFLTLASHEPWKVPYNRIPNDEKANGMAYLDSCLGTFVDKIKKLPLWDNLLIICIADHGINWPSGLTEASAQRSHIPLLWMGGALKQARLIPVIMNQSDLPATLLGQMGISHQDFPFSRDVLSASYQYPSATHTFDNGYAFIDSTGITVEDFDGRRFLADDPEPSAHRQTMGRAFLQNTIADLDRR